MLKFCLFTSLPIPILLILIYSIPIDEQRLYGMVGKNCLNRGHWLEHRISKPDSLQLAFLGSSHTIHAVSEELLASHQGRDINQIANFGHCHYGRDMQYLILKKVLEAHRPKTVVLEIREDEYYESHFDFPCFCSVDDLGVAVQFSHRKDVVREAVTCRLQTLQQDLFEYPFNVAHTEEPFGYRPREGVIDPEKANLEKQNYKEIIRKYGDTSGRLPFYYMEAIQALCIQADIQLYFLYLPSFDSPAVPESLSYYEGLGTVLLPPDSLLNNPAHYFEFNHMNPQGAAVISEWLATVLL